MFYMKTTVRKTCNILLDFLIIILGIIILVNVYSFIQIKILNKDYSSFFGYSTFEVQTGSMKPSISPSDVIIVKSDKNPKVNDIITFKKKNDFITHRVVEKSGNTYITKGDANNARDAAITSDDIVGRVVHVLPKFGIIRKTILNPFVIITLIITASTIYYLFNKKKKKFYIDKKDLNESTPTQIEASMLDEETIDVEDEDETFNEEENTVEDEPSEEENTKEEKDEIKDLDEELVDASIAMNSEPMSEEDLEKTIVFRKISVDAEDLNPPAPVVEEEEEEIIPTEEVSAEIENEDEEKNAEFKLEYLNKRKKKFNNILEKVMYFKEEEITELVNIIYPSKFKKVNEASIEEELLRVYIDGKYYNLVGNVNAAYNSKNMNLKLGKIIASEGERLIKSYKGNDISYSSKVDFITNVFITVLHIEDIFTSDITLDEKIVQYKEKMNKYLKGYFETDEDLTKAIKKLIICQRSYKGAVNKLIDTLKTNTFDLEFNELATKKNIYALNLKHNINFSKLYSDYIIDKTYDEGIVAEDKILVTISILLGRIANDILSCNTDDIYLLYIPDSLYEKSNKLGKVVSMLNDEMVKNRVILVNKIDAISKNKKIIKQMKKEGFRFGLLVRDGDKKITDKTNLALTDYVFIDKKLDKELKLSSTLKNNLDINVIKENIDDLIDVSGGV